MISIDYQIQEFYRDLFNIDDKAVRFSESLDANTPLKTFFRKYLQVGESDDAAREALCAANKKYLEEHNITIDNERNIYHLYEDRYVSKSQVGDGDKFFATFKQVKAPQRQTLIRIAFSLGMKSKDCNNMFAAAGQYALHKGGNARESIYYYCLEEGRSIVIAEDMYRQFLGLTEPINSHQPETSLHLSQRTEFNANAIEDFLKRNKQLLQEEKDRSFVAFLQTIAYTFTESSGRAWRLVENMHKKIPVNAFLLFWGPALRYGPPYMNNLRTDVRKERSVPSRDYICLLATAVYYKEEVHNQPLLDFVNEHLLGCGLGPLMAHQHPDSLIIELSRYDVDNCKKNKITFKDKYNKQQQLVLSNVNGKNSFEIAKHIVAEYTGGKYNLVQPLRNMCLGNADAFFEREKGKKNET